METFLSKIVFHTGSMEYSELRLVKAFCTSEAYDAVKKWFETEYPESKWTSIVVLPTIEL